MTRTQTRLRRCFARRSIDHRVLTLCVTVALGLAPALVVLDMLSIEAVAARLAIGGFITLVAGRLFASMLIPPPADNRQIYGPERLDPEHDAPRAV